MKIKVEKPTPEKLKQLGVEKWPVWTKEKSTFDWEYDSIEVCYLLKGKVKVHTPDGGITEFGAGDLVTFSKGLKCRWEVIEPVKKHYMFEECEC